MNHYPLAPVIKPPTAPIEVHISDVLAYKACRRAWNWSSRLRNNLEPRRPYKPFFFGRMVHTALESWYAYGTPFEASLTEFLATEVKKMSEHGVLWPGEEGLIEEQLTLANNILQHRALWERRMSKKGSRFGLSNIRFLSVEQEFRVPIVDPRTGEDSDTVFFAGKWDGLVELIDDGSLWLWEEKTARSVPERLATLDNDEQASSYLWVARRIFGPRLKGIIYTAMAKRAPSPPKVLASGLLSRDTRGQSYDSYLGYIKAHHGDDVDREFIGDNYGDALIGLYEEAEGNTFFSRVPIIRNEHALAEAGEELYYVAMEMANPNTPIFKRSSHDCKMCIFHEPCIALQNGSDNVDLLLEDNYVQRQGTHEGETIVVAD
jgi:hypothetical protein